MRAFFFLFITSTLLVQSIMSHGQPAYELERYMSDVRASQTPHNKEVVMNASSVNAILKAIPTYYRDSLSSVRSAAYTVTASHGLKSKEQATRSLAVSILVLAVHDKDAGNVGQLWNLLSKFNRMDFNQDARDSLKSVFHKSQYQTPQLLKLIGFLEITELIEEIRPLTLPPYNKQVRWAAMLALARMGDAASIESVMQRSQKLKLNDDVVYEIFPDLIYTRQQTAIQYLITVIQSDDKNCHSADAENEMPIPCAYRVMEQLAPVVEGYPILVDASGDIRTKNYEKALSEVRKWVTKQGTNLKIKKESM